ncbi:hypothetical protein VB834_15210 [Limnoraphis robusta Tam1]|uniref:Uncharacterized protein n=1 Tax=Limnoraphis robusta CCNP1315 TaxID=3110306 RepID=A0ABU5U3H6_9CYAN|nr:hypothetical protein [Limnoraphis robusta]MEA5498349.1 hypothetical protein [Limnoraphis robusta BA-68 BA1]MEA5521620.1 hypothetical protein [Limnoraphis robusta CCNP1315]MEA5540373.1 hypothetical protein [Limnoraphis robusta Tam1]MEA5545196.1 hypothetical protein [Limnoraphis robusta CCNP1324]
MNPEEKIQQLQQDLAELSHILAGIANHIFFQQIGVITVEDMGKLEEIIIRNQVKKEII